ncbi:hypothetical protein Ciccas_004057 [Cichlidogyrus casuarinus]|uniref:Ras-associating domain-containing protein n=1 Tax=Cichlidogyrus casuarinus TaxID=1844966 RepID=A0ABD2QDI1_9PLAT
MHNRNPNSPITSIQESPLFNEFRPNSATLSDCLSSSNSPSTSIAGSSSQGTPASGIFKIQPSTVRSNGFSRPSPSISTNDLTSGSTQPEGGLVSFLNVKFIPKLKIVVRIFSKDKTTKALKIHKTTPISEVCRMLIEKNFCKPSTKWALVEKVPALRMERVFEEHELLSDCVLAWPECCQNMIFFEERDDHFGFIVDPVVSEANQFELISCQFRSG